MVDKFKQMQELIKVLNEASDVYYNSSKRIMPDYEWDAKYEELKKIEKETGITYVNSPTANVGHAVCNKIPKVKHNHLMLSLDKCHSVDDLIKFSGNKTCLLSVKCDGLTTSLRYVNGKLVGAETRGNGIEGGDVLVNVMTIKNVPHTIPYDKELIVDGETIIDWDMFNQINESLPEGQEKYKHPRNLVSGSLNLLDTELAAKRNMRFIAWRVIKGIDNNSVSRSLIDISKMGFEVVPFLCDIHSAGNEGLSRLLEELRKMADEKQIPYDGAVMTYDDIKYGDSLGRTEKFFKHSIAYKYEDELYTTKLVDIEWNTSKTGLINPVAVFEPVDLSGAITTRATLHNVSYLEKLQLGIGDTVQIYRANMVVPKIHDNITRSGIYKIPDKCPCCGGDAIIQHENESKTLYCTNPDCQAKLLGRLVHFVSKDAMNIDSFSEQSLKKFIELGWIHDMDDIYKLYQHKDEMYQLERFGKRSVDKLLDNIETSKNTTLDRFIYALSIPLVGRKASKTIANYFHQSINDFLCAGLDGFDFANLPEIGSGINQSIQDYIRNRWYFVCQFANNFNFKAEKKRKRKSIDLSGKTFVITGSLYHYKNRNELTSIIEDGGGNVSSSVSAKTTYLINNDKQSTSSKNKKAQKLGIPIITEEEFMSMIGE